MGSIAKRSERRRISKGPRSKEQFFPAPIARSLAQRLVEHEIIFFSWENRNALWFGLVLTFSLSQLACFKVLWENFLRGNLPIPNERILCGLRGDTTHIYHLFKRHPAWKRVIVGDGRGNFWLQLPGLATRDLDPNEKVLIDALNLSHGDGYGRNFFSATNLPRLLTPTEET